MVSVWRICDGGATRNLSMLAGSQDIYTTPLSCFGLFYSDYRVMVLMDAM